MKKILSIFIFLSFIMGCYKKDPCANSTTSSSTCSSNNNGGETKCIPVGEISYNNNKEYIFVNSSIAFFLSFKFSISLILPLINISLILSIVLSPIYLIFFKSLILSIVIFLVYFNNIDITFLILSNL